MAYGVNPRFAEGIAIDRITNGGRGIDDYDQRDLVRRGMMPSKQAIINEQQNQQRMSRESLKQEKLRTKALQQAIEQQDYDRWKQGWNDFAEAHGRGRTPQGKQSGSRQPRYNPTATAPTVQQPRYSYEIDHQAAADAGEFLRSLEAGDVATAVGLLNKNQYSSINNASGLNIATDDKGNQALSVIDKEGQVLRTIPMERVRRQLSNLNNYATRKTHTYDPGREALMDDTALLEGAEAARDEAKSSSYIKGLGFDQHVDRIFPYPKDTDGVWSKPDENGGIDIYDPDKQSKQAYAAYMEQYGARDPSMNSNVDKGFYNTQSGAGLGFATTYRQKPGTANPNGASAKSLAEQAAGSKRNPGQTVNLPEPNPNNHPQQQAYVGYWGGGIRAGR